MMRSNEAPNSLRNLKWLEHKMQVSRSAACYPHAKLTAHPVDKCTYNLFVLSVSIYSGQAAQLHSAQRGPLR